MRGRERLAGPVRTGLGFVFSAYFGIEEGVRAVLLRFAPGSGPHEFLLVAMAMLP